jgi:hypothetical protein
MPSANSRDERRLDDVRFDILSQLARIIHEGGR